MSTRVDFLCNVAVRGIGLIYPASFQVARTAAGHAVRRDGKVCCRLVGRHPTGCGTLQEAMQWQSGIDVPILSGINMLTLPYVGQYVWFTEKDLGEVFERLAADEAA